MEEYIIQSLRRERLVLETDHKNATDLLEYKRVALIKNLDADVSDRARSQADGSPKTPPSGPNSQRQR